MQRRRICIKYYCTYNNDSKLTMTILTKLHNFEKTYLYCDRQYRHINKMPWNVYSPRIFIQTFRTQLRIIFLLLFRTPRWILRNRRTTQETTGWPWRGRSSWAPRYCTFSPSFCSTWCIGWGTWCENERPHRIQKLYADGKGTKVFVCICCMYLPN